MVSYQPLSTESVYPTLSRPGASRTRLQILACAPHGRRWVGIIFACTTLVFFLRKQSGPDVYASTPFCSPDGGRCGEAADVPSPRTVYSARSQKQHDDWWKFHAALNVSALEYANEKHDEGTVADRRRRPRLIFLGDSITESFLGTELGAPSSAWDGIPEVFEEMYGAKYEALVLGISGDQTQHLLWRLEHGNLLAPYADDPQAVFYLMIGTNNLGAGHFPEDATRGVMAVANHLMEHIKGRLVVVEVLPRGDSFRLERICAPRCDRDGKPYKSFTPAVDKVNAALREQIPARSKQYDGRMRLVNCGAVFAPDRESISKGEEVNQTLMPDSLHPNAEGHKALAECVLRCIENGDC